MPPRNSLNVSLTPELQRFVGSRVKTGRYGSASEVVREALRLLQDRERQREAAITGLRKQIEEGIAAADRGELVDGPAVFRELRERRRRRAKAG